MSLPHLHFSSLEYNEVYGDIVETYRLAAASLGYPTTRQDGHIDASAINLLFFYWTRPWSELAQHRERCILVNFEPLSEGSHAFNAQYLQTLRNAYRWDYSKTDFHRAIDLRLGPGDYVPLGYQASAATEVSLSDRLTEEEQDIDVLFFGLLTPRRQHVFDQLRARGLRLQVSDGPTYWSIAERDAYMRRAKVVVNFHRMEDHRMVEIHRLSILFRHRKAIVTELYPDSEIDPSLREVVVGAPYANLIETIDALVKDRVKREALEAAGLPTFAKLNHARRMAPALDRFLAWRKWQTTCKLASNITSRQSTQMLDLCLASLHSNTSPAHVIAKNSATSKGVLVEPPCDALSAAAAWNQCILRSRGTYLTFLKTSDEIFRHDFGPHKQILEICPDVDIVVSVYETIGQEVPPAQISDELTARLLSAHPLQLAGTLFRRAFLERAGICFDEELQDYAGLNFLCKCAARGGRFASVLVQRLEMNDQRAGQTVQTRLSLSQSLQTRAPLLAALLPDLTHRESSLVAELRSTHWPADISFLERMLITLARALVNFQTQTPPTVDEYLVRELRRDAAHMLRVFHNAGLITQAWMDTLFSNVRIAAFLAPTGRALPFRPREKTTATTTV